MSEQRSSLIRIYTVCHSFYIFWRHYFIVKLICFILRTTTVAGLGVPIFRVYGMVFLLQKPGSQIVVYGSLKLESDLPKKCFVEVFKKGEGQKVDYFSCQDCGFKCKYEKSLIIGSLQLLYLLRPFLLTSQGCHN